MVEAAIALFCLVLPISIAYTNIAAGALTAALLAQGRLDFRRVRNPAFYTLSAYLAVAVLVSAAGLSPHTSFLQLNKDLHKSWILGLLLLALPLAGSFRPPRALGLGFALIAVFSLLHEVQERFVTHLWYRAHGFVHPVTFGEQMALACLAGICFLSRAQDGREKRLAAWWLVPVTLALLLSQTRAAWLGVAAGYAALCAVDASFRRRGLWVLGAGAAVAGVWLLDRAPNGRSIAAYLNNLNAGNSQWDRLYLWDVALKISRDHPLLGVGPGNFGASFKGYFQTDLLFQDQVWTSAHNLYLHQLAERGLLGLAALLAFLYALTARALARVKESATAWNLWALSAMAAFWVMNLTEVAFQNEQVMTLTLFIWAWAEANHPTPAN